jgi:hypothetical protein
MDCPNPDEKAAPANLAGDTLLTANSFNLPETVSGVLLTAGLGETAEVGARDADVSVSCVGEGDACAIDSMGANANRKHSRRHFITQCLPFGPSA